MFDPEFERKGKRHAVDVPVPKRLKSEGVAEQEYEDDVEAFDSTGSSSSSSSSVPFIVPSRLGKRSYEEAFGLGGTGPQFEADRPDWYNEDVVRRDVPLLTSLREEVKHREFDDWEDDCTNLGFINLINGIATGATSITRNGNKVVLRSISLRGMMYPFAEVCKNTINHIWIIYDTQPNGALPTLADIFEGSNGFSFIKYDQRYRFIPLVHRFWDLGMQSATMSDNCITSISIYKNINRVTYFKGTGADIADISYGALYVVGVGVANDNYSILNYNMRLLYTED